MASRMERLSNDGRAEDGGGAYAKARLSALRCTDYLRLGAVHPHLPATGSRLAVVQEAIGPAAPELGRAEMPDAAEDAGDSPARPRQRILNLGERARVIGRGGQRVQEFAHEVAAAVVKPLDLAGIIHRVLGSVLVDGGRR